MNHRESLLNLIENQPVSDRVPAAFFMHFDSDHKQGQAAIDRHLEFFRYTGMDFVKVQYEQTQPAGLRMLAPKDWVNAPLYPPEFFEAPAQVVEGLVKAAGREALVIMTLYSPFMWASQLDPQADLAGHLQENPEAVSKGLAIMTENALGLVRACKRAGADGFYVSTQGGEAFRFPNTDIFRKFIRPTDLAVWEEVRPCPFNILHICDYEGGYADLTPFLDYPGEVVNCSLKLGDRRLSPKEVSQMFARPFMGGLERKGVLATGGTQAIRQAVDQALADVPERFILAADCTVPGDTPWDNLKTAIEHAHQFRR